MILHAVALQEVARKLMDGEFASGRSHAHAVLLALAVEIALKAWQCRERKGGDPDHSHCLVKLFDRLSEDAQERLQTRMPEHPWPRGAEHARLSGNPFGGGIRVVLEAHRNTFEAWRYSYEHDALYTWPPQLDEALTAIIDTYNPLHVIRLPGLGNLVR